MIDVNKMTPEEFAVFQFEMKANMRNKRTGEYYPKVKELLKEEALKAKKAKLELKSQKKPNKLKEKQDEKSENEK